MRSCYPITLAMIVFIASVSPAVAADVAQNGSFEVPDVIGIDSPAVPGWTNVAFIFDGNGGYPGQFPDAGSDGTQYADFANKRSRIASQAFSVGPGLVIAAITWDATTGGGGGSQAPYVARLKDGTGAVVLETGNFVAIGGAEYNTWDSETLPVPSNPSNAYGTGNYILEFFADQDAGSDLLADNVVIETGLPIPEPASLILLMGGSLLAIKRKRS